MSWQYQQKVVFLQSKKQQQNKKKEMNILVTGANGQLGNEMRIVSKNTTDHYLFTDVNQVEGVETTYLDITDMDAIRKMVSENHIDAIINCAAWTNVSSGQRIPERGGDVRARRGRPERAQEGKGYRRT